MTGSSTGLTCPTCDADVPIVFNEQCADCGGEDVVAVIERLRPEGER